MWKVVGRIETKLGSFHAGDTEHSTITLPLLQYAFRKLPEPIREVSLPADAAPAHDNSKPSAMPFLGGIRSSQLDYKNITATVDPHRTGRSPRS